MNTVKIGTDERSLDSADAQWINQQINNRRNNGESVCVVVRISMPEVEITLATATCGGGGRSLGNKEYSQRELAVLSLWNERGLNQVDFTGGGLVAFLNQLRRI